MKILIRTYFEASERAFQDGGLRAPKYVPYLIALQRKVETDYKGIELPNEFVIGYGLDYKGRYRNLPIYVY